MPEQVCHHLPGAAAAVGPIDMRDLVRKAIDELKPHLNRDGGDITLVDIDDDLVIVDMSGNCAGCILASATLAGVRKRLFEITGRRFKVVPRSAIAVLPVSVRREELQ